MRETERLVKNSLTPKIIKNAPPPCEKTEQIIEKFQKIFGLNVTAKIGAKGAGKLVIDYSSVHDLDILINNIEIKKSNN